MYKRIGKRTFDLTFSILALCIMMPLILVIVLFVWVDLGCPIFFSQKRPGLNKKLFTLHKFRTMTIKAAQGEVLPDADRLTSFGCFLRSTSLDELPELVNVIRGEMSIVGPRPLLTEYLDLYSPEQSQRHECKPGITGLAQVSGRNAITWEQRFALDKWYVDHLSFSLDLMIMTKTLWKLIRREGINQPGHATMERFRGAGGENEQ